ncbi:MAG: transposase [Smithellaceae bacterium]|nr:transposase [Smithellaceae bacterium]
MLNINSIGDIAMFHARDHKTSYLLDPWDYLGPKRRKLLDASWAGLFREHILSGLPVRKIASCYADGFGRPSKEIYASLGALILQQMHDLTDEETVSQFSFNLQWHYALDIPGESDEAKYLCTKTLWTLRQLVTERGLDRELFNTTTETLAKVFGVDTSKQRIDSVHIRSNMRRLGRICIFSRSIHNFLVNLKRQRREIFDTIEKELVDRYLTEKALGCFSLVKPSESTKTLETVSQDLFSLVERFRQNKQVKSLTTFGVLLRVLKDQCTLSAVDTEPAEMALKEPKKILSSSLQNPSDPDAGYDAHKGQGYKVQVMETYCASSDETIKEKTLNLITYVEVESAHNSDTHALIPALESTTDRRLAPEQVLADSPYGSDHNLKQANQLGVEVIAPVKGRPKEDTLSLADFPQTDKGMISACPQGHTPVKFKQGKKGHCSIAFTSEHCNVCVLLEQCPVKPGRKRHYLRFDLKALRSAGRRAKEHTAEFKDKYRWRSGIESTFSEMDKKTGVKRLRVRGMSAVAYCARLKAIGVNLFRATRVKRAIDTFRTAPGDLAYTIRSIIHAVKERLLRPWRQGWYLSLPASVYRTYNMKTAA